MASVQDSINQIHLYLQKRSLEISPQKSKFLVFTRKRIVHEDIPNLKLNDVSIPQANSIKFLGITLDSKLRGNLHLNYLVRRGKAVTDIISSLAGIW